MDIQHLILFCAAQTIILILIFLQKKFRSLPNMILVSIFFLLLLHYVYYYFYYEGAISYGTTLSFSILPLTVLPVSLIYFYCISMIYGKLKLKTKDIIYFSPFIIISLLFIPVATINNPVYYKNISLIAGEILAFSFLAASALIIYRLAEFYQINTLKLKTILSYHKRKTTIVRLFIFLTFIHFLVLAIKVNLGLIFPHITKTFDIINLGFLLALSYINTWVIVSNPKAVIFEDQRVGLGGFKKYEKSGLTKAKAQDKVNKLNQIMEEQKPFLNPDFNLYQFSKISKIPAHTISEILNGLIGQSFSDYANNYRIEEFKLMAAKPRYKNFTILALAHEAGFKSKATFNACFKKFTGQTPSEYIQSLKKE